MPRKTKAATNAEQLRKAAISRIEPPEYLNERQRDAWTRLVGFMPADYFHPSDEPLLVAYVVAIVAHRDASVALVGGMTVKDEKGRPWPNPAVGSVQQLSSTLGTLATKLRLAPQSRYNTQAAGRKADSNGAGRASRPWETPDDEE